MAEWYYARNNQRLGPVTLEQLKQLAASGQLSANDLVWKEGMANWAAASTVPGIFGAPSAPAAAPRPAVVSPPQSASAPNDVVALPLGSGGPSIVDTAMLIGTRAVAPDLDTLKVAEDEKAELSKAGITGETAQRYLVWRRSLLWLSAVPLVFVGISLAIDSACYTLTSDSLNGLGVLLEILRLITLLALPAAAILAAWTWSKPKQSQMIATLGLLVCYGLPLGIELLPMSWLTKNTELGGQGFNIGALPVPMMFAVILSLFSLPPAILRGCLRIRTLLPEASATGLLLVGSALLSALFFFLGTSVLFSQLFATQFLGLLFTLCLFQAPLCHVIGARTYLRPLTTPADHSAVARWQWIYFGLCGVAALLAIVQMIASDVKPGLYGFWIVLLLYLDFVGRSLFASVVAGQYVMSLSRAVLLTQNQVTKSDQGAILDRRLSELEPIVGKL